MAIYCWGHQRSPVRLVNCAKAMRLRWDSPGRSVRSQRAAVVRVLPDDRDEGAGSASFYSNLLGWKPTYDEGSQHELMIGEVGDIIVRGGNPNDPNFGKNSAALVGNARLDHISFGISPWDTDRVKVELEKRDLKAEIDTSTRDDIHVAAYKSYHTTTPNGYDLQISYVTHDNRLALANAVKPKPSGSR